jgi:hypothetical protein
MAIVPQIYMEQQRADHHSPLQKQDINERRINPASVGFNPAASAHVIHYIFVH